SLRYCRVCFGDHNNRYASYSPLRFRSASRWTYVFCRAKFINGGGILPACNPRIETWLCNPYGGQWISNHHALCSHVWWRFLLWPVERLSGIVTISNGDLEPNRGRSRQIENSQRRIILRKIIHLPLSIVKLAGGPNAKLTRETYAASL